MLITQSMIVMILIMAYVVSRKLPVITDKMKKQMKQLRTTP